MLINSVYLPQISESCIGITFVVKKLCSALEITELIELNIQRERAETTSLMKGCVLGSNGGSSSCKVGSMAIIWPNWIKKCTQIRQPQLLGFWCTIWKRKFKLISMETNTSSNWNDMQTNTKKCYSHESN